MTQKLENIKLTPQRFVIRLDQLTMSYLFFFTRYGVPAGRPRGGWDRPSAGHHAECGGPMDTPTWSTYIREPEDWMHMNIDPKRRERLQRISQEWWKKKSEKGLKTAGQHAVSSGGNYPNS